MPSFISNTVQVHIAAFDRQKNEIRYLVIRRSDNLPVYPSAWQVITGRIEEGETAIEAAKREVFEETALMPEKIWTLPYVATWFETAKDLVHASPVFGFLVDYESGITLSDEHQDFKWLKYKECRDYLKIYSHRTGTKIFRDYILRSDEPDLFIYE